MDLTQLKFDENTETVDILSPSHFETIEAIQYLIDEGYIDASDFQNAYFTSKAMNDPLVEIESDYSSKKYKKVLIHSINFNHIDIEEEYYGDVECAITILKMFHLYMFDSIEDVLKDKELYVLPRGYTVLVDKSGLFRWETRYGAQFICD